MPVGVKGPSEWWLVGLLVVWAALLFGGFAFGREHDTGTRRMPTWTRIGSSLALAMAAWSWYALSSSNAGRLASLLVALGMSLGLVGDLCLVRLFPLPQPVLAGMAAFGLGHIAYNVTFLRLGEAYVPGASLPGWGAWEVWGAWLLVGLIGWYVVVFRRRKRSTIHWAALPYSLLLASAAGVATSLALQAGIFAPAAVGTAAFLASDLVLAGQLFGGLRFRLIGDVIWLLYGPGQMLIVYGTNAAVRVHG